MVQQLENEGVVSLGDREVKGRPTSRFFLRVWVRTNFEKYLNEALSPPSAQQDEAAFGREDFDLEIEPLRYANGKEVREDVCTRGRGRMSTRVAGLADDVENGFLLARPKAREVV
eukprot:CAMPEP_0206508408 /NCGR_PEP_ID=MMETSP0324_2-20121206/58314_1 /ASSEMBLY_ACC=CAM_ASM_000836 /TAXON_ID=2866 /ORGANISM="Crypthecodinium cohnii, Strain Seligo" /LENGTH=114 /DNA_ID=CAMNT_0053999265 /DNA_START=1015 /DNA_END=1359 /DNA_ORIENTATION=-